jgi:hypothetical protein
MPLSANKVSTNSGFRQAPLEAGPYPARIVKVIDLGLQPQSYKGEDKDPAYKISVTYELLDEFMLDEDGNTQEDKPRWLSEEMPLFSLQAERAKSTQRYLTLDPQRAYDGDWTQLLGVPCTVTIINNPGRGKNEGRVFNNVGTISPMRAKDAATAPALVNAPVSFNTDEPDMVVFDAQPDFIKEKITSNLEFQGSKLQELISGVSAPVDAPAGETNYMDDDEKPESF